MAQKFVYVDAAGVLRELEGQVVSTGAADAGKIFVPGADGRWDLSLMPVGIGASTKSIVASETMTAPCLVNLWNDGGTLKARYADASSASAGKRAHGFLLASVTSGNSGEVYFEGEITGFTGLTPGSEYFLSNGTPGGVTTTAVTTAGHILQRVGVALGATSVGFEPSDPIIRA